MSADSSRTSTRATHGCRAPNDAHALQTIGIDLAQVRARIEESFGPGALELALREVTRLGHREIGSEHVLLGLVRGDASSELLQGSRR